MPAMNIGQQVPDLELCDVARRTHRLADYRGRVAILNFWSSQCPHVERTDRLLKAWEVEWGARVIVISIAPNGNEGPAEVAGTALERQLTVLLLDSQQAAVDLFEAQTTPHVFVVDPGGRLRYRGAVDDASFSKRVPSRFYLKEAVDALLADRAPSVSETPPYGCAIIRHALE